MKKTLVVVFLIAISACSKTAIEIENAYTPVRTEKQKMYAAYLDITNHTDSPVELVSANSENFESVMLHQSSMENGMAKMRHLDKVMIASKKSVKFEPNGKHIMLMGAKDTLWDKESYILELEFSDGNKVQHTIKVKQ